MKLSIAELTVEIFPAHELLQERVGPYLCDEDRQPDLCFDGVTERYYRDRAAEHPEITLAESEYLYSGVYFYEQLARFEGLMLHASAVELDGLCYLFSAPSGTGKSTHSHIWLRVFPGARIINDDKPAIRRVNGRFMAYGTPWSGKTDESVNVGVPIAGVCFLGRGENAIRRLTPSEAFPLFMDQTVRPYDKSLMLPMLQTLDTLLREVPFYQMTCDMTDDAAHMSRSAMQPTEELL